jgi:ribosomal protein S18 acetylase RimI-like enzyme
VLANDLQGGPRLAERMELVEAFYARHGLPARYQISPASRPDGLAAALAERGYLRRLQVLVLCAPLAEVLERLPPPGGRVALAGEPDAAWLETLRALLGYYGDGTAVRRILRGIGPPAAYAFAGAGRPLAIGRAVAERGFAGVFGMATLPEARGQGLGTAVLAALAGWAAGHGATRLYLQVDHDNAGAVRLYRRAGFEAVYAYHYRENAPSG